VREQLGFIPCSALGLSGVIAKKGQVLPALMGVIIPLTDRLKQSILFYTGHLKSQGQKNTARKE